MATAILGGNVEICADPVASEVSLLKAGRVRALATSDKFPDLDQLPTFAEAGFPGINISSWVAIVAPKGLPKPVLDKLVLAFGSAAKNATVIQQLHREAMNADFKGPEDFARKLEQDYAIIREIAKKIGMIK